MRNLIYSTIVTILIAIGFNSFADKLNVSFKGNVRGAGSTEKGGINGY